MTTNQDAAPGHAVLISRREYIEVVARVDLTAFGPSDLRGAVISAVDNGTGPRVTVTLTWHGFNGTAQGIELRGVYGAPRPATDPVDHYNTRVGHIDDLDPALLAELERVCGIRFEDYRR